MSEPALTWNKKGIERLEYFIAEGIALSVTDVWDNETDALTDKLRCVQGQRKDGAEAPDFLRMTPSEAGILMAHMMADELKRILVNPAHIPDFVQVAIERATQDEDYDREHKEPEEYEIP